MWRSILPSSLQGSSSIIRTGQGEVEADMSLLSLMAGGSSVSRKERPLCCLLLLLIYIDLAFFCLGNKQEGWDRTLLHHLPPHLSPLFLPTTPTSPHLSAPPLHTPLHTTIHTYTTSLHTHTHTTSSHLTPPLPAPLCPASFSSYSLTYL